MLGDVGKGQDLGEPNRQLRSTRDYVDWRYFLSAVNSKCCILFSWHWEQKQIAYFSASCGIILEPHRTDTLSNLTNAKYASIPIALVDFPQRVLFNVEKFLFRFSLWKKIHVSANLQALLLLIANANGPFLFCTSITQSAGRREELKKKQTNTRNEYIATPAMHNQSHHVHKYD